MIEMWELLGFPYYVLICLLDWTEQNLFYLLLQSILHFAMDFCMKHL